MQLELEEALPRKLFFPHTQCNRNYHLLFLRSGKGPFFVRDAKYKLDTLFRIGEIYSELDEHRIRVVGNIFYTKSNVIQSEGPHLIAYSGVFYEQVQRKKSLESTLNMELVLRERGFHVFNQKNKATMVIVPSLSESIRNNLEI